MQNIRRILLITAALGFAVMPLLSQAPAPKKPAFEVTSVKPAAPGTGFRGGGPRGNSLTMTNAPLRQLVQMAYQRGGGQGPGIQMQVIGAPSWMDTELYDIQAKADCSGGPIPREQMQLMIQSMLEERFQLKAHLETRELPIYNLTVAKDGPKMKASEDQSTATTLPAGGPLLCGPQPAGIVGPGGRGGPVPLDPRGPLPRGAMMMMMNPTTGMTLNATAVPIANLIGLLQNQTGRPIIDKTDLKGLFDVKLNFSMEGLPGPAGLGGIPTPFGPIPGGGPGPAGPGAVPAPNTAAEPVPSLFTAVQEQLGLKLESTKGPVEVLIVDSIQKPAEN
jgi:bla regulator protein blaR1